MKVKVRSAYAVITTGIGMPGSMFWVKALNSFTNAMMFRPRWPSAGPTGGDGFALPAGICNLIYPTIFFAIRSLVLVHGTAVQTTLAAEGRPTISRVPKEARI